MNSEEKPSTDKTTGKKKKLNVQSATGLLLTPGSSRRKNAWNRLRDSLDNRGMTQAQISDYLKSQMKKVYANVRQEGALTHEKVDRYLEYLARTASQTLVQTKMNQENIDHFSQKTEPLLIDIGSKESLTESDIKKHTLEITEKAKEQVVEINHPQQIPASPEPEPEPEVSKEPIAAVEPEFLEQEIVPVGFEEGAPKITVEAFLGLPLSTRDKGPEEDDPYQAHLKFLEMAVSKACLNGEELEKVKQAMTEVPGKRYKSYFNIFPGREYDDTKMMIVYSRWRNQTLDSLLMDNDQDVSSEK
jgi:hypothetical protein